jgi:heme exporter protein C
MLTRLANPVRFERFAKVAEPIAAAASIILLPLALWFALVQSPAAEDHGETVRILYVHVASAWSMMAGYTALAVASFVYFVWRHSLADVAARAIAIPGVVMTALCLITGSLWGKPAWNTWWQWDGRMTSVLLLLFIYLGYFAVRALDEDRQKSARLAAILAMVGAVNIPIIKFSVDWWAGLHQPATLSAPGAPGLAGPLFTPLALMMLAYTAVFSWFVLHEMRGELRERAANRRVRAPASVTVETVSS